MAVSSAAQAAEAAVASGSSTAGNPAPIPLGIAKDLPNAGIYMQMQNQAELAYQQAQAELLAKKNTAYHQFGLTGEAGVDPQNQFGRYQQLLSSQERELSGADEMAQQRHLGGSGLGMQGETALRYTQGADSLALQEEIAGTGRDYASGIQQALAARNAAVLGAQLSAASGGIVGSIGGAGGAGGAGGSGGFGTPWDDAIASAIPAGWSFGQMANNGQPVTVSSPSQLDRSGGWGVVGSGAGTYVAVKLRGPDGKANTVWIKVGDPAGSGPQQTQTTTPQTTTTQQAVKALATKVSRTRPGIE